MSQPLTVTEALEVAAAVNACFTGSGVDTENHCDIASDVTCAILRARGYDAHVILGEFFYDSHFWVSCDGVIVDPTIDQFDDRRPFACPQHANESRDLYLPQPGRDPRKVNARSVSRALAQLPRLYPSSAPAYHALAQLLDQHTVTAAA